MKQISKSNSSSRVLRIVLSASVNVDTLKVLHTSGLTGNLPQQLRDILQNAGSEQMSSVYQLSAEEIINDKYGFACEFKVTLKTSADMDTAIILFKNSSLIKEVKPITIGQSW